MSQVYSVFLLFVVLLKTVYSQSDEGDCQVHDDNFCKATCQYKGTTIELDISTIVSYPYHIVSTTSNVNGYFDINLCGRKCQESDDILSAVCLTDADQNNKIFSCGGVNSHLVTWILVNTDPYQFTIVYQGGDPVDGANLRQSQFVFNQTSNEQTSITFSSYDGNTLYLFQVTGNCIGQLNCAKGHHSTTTTPDGIIGIVLIGMFILGIVTYFIVGMLIMKYYKGAQGKEIIPHVFFWLDLPFLIKDGCLFVISPCYKRKDSYEEL